MNWGKSIVVAFILFAGFIGTLVTVCVRQDVNLVSKDYYREELVYQDQIEREENTATLAVRPEIVVTSGGYLQVAYPGLADVEKGEVLLYSAADPTRDRVLILDRSASGLQEFDVNQMPRGVYTARMKWQMGGREFYLEKTIHL